MGEALQNEIAEEQARHKAATNKLNQELQDIETGSIMYFFSFYGFAIWEIKKMP